MRLPVFIIAGVLALPAQQEAPTFRASTALVRVDAQVLDKGQPVTGLQAGDFVVKEDGVAQPLVSLGMEAEPLQVVFVLDVSGSMGRVLVEMGAAAQKALEALRPGDEVGVLLYATRTKMVLELTADRRSAVLAIRDAAEEKDLGGGSSLYQALMDAAAYLRALPPYTGRRAIAVLSDNGGVSRDLPNQTVLRALSEANAVVTAAVTKEAKPPAPPARGVEINTDFTRHDIFLIAGKTGGEVVRLEKGAAEFRPLMERLRTRYLLSYKPAPGGAGAYRKIEVELAPAARARYRNAVVRARAGYFPSAEEAK
jgi:VWFA-related protein